ncbi:glutaminase A [Brachybacterium saurashtrense]|uniref:glutaminase n=1 Tax=Brachybacterium saurashtrense TaxID=556288 RepID=A0A345YK37_9MICO|nr:glutaminase A [Brachybacterium saurashtrense]AXK44289.1 glutaminase A [Brachybacterium saurashtrense]RRR21325.1 glutaminase A [Brachybacterium saurashtrense]RRR22900.1 glutaminase A [Brachybacterium saurashtrense]
MTDASTSLALYLDRLTAALSTATADEDPEAVAVDRGIIGGADALGDIPALSFLSGAREEHLGAAVCSVDGEITAAGTDHAFPLQSISKAFAYGAAIDLHGMDYVDEVVDEEPTGEEFNALSIDRHSRKPKNPLVNIGAIRTHAMLGGEQAERTERLRAVLDAAAGRPLALHRETYLEELGTSDRNLALAYMLRAAGSMDEDAAEVVAGYIEGCAVLTTVTDLAVMAATLASGGTNPLTGEEVFSRVAARQVLSVMFTCGMYDNAGDWVSDVGLPAKSGVGGGIIAALPSRFGVASYAPQLDLHGNSVRGTLFFERLSADFALHMLDGVEPRDLEECARELMDAGTHP